jgi:hypothetical protein
MEKLNCWQFKNCGRERGGLFAEQLGECPVATALKYDGQNGGQGAGRVCWLVGKGCSAGRSTRNCQDHGCHTCDFYRRVLFEEEITVTGAYHSAAT